MPVLLPMQNRMQILLAKIYFQAFGLLTFLALSYLFFQQELFASSFLELPAVLARQADFPLVPQDEKMATLFVFLVQALQYSHPLFLLLSTGITHMYINQKNIYLYNFA